MKNIFDPAVTQELINRINALTPETAPNWGKMTVDQMMAHCSVAYEMAYTEQVSKAKCTDEILIENFRQKWSGKRKTLSQKFPYCPCIYYY